ncbi:MAG: SDR family NAD(P)-dependent oxidoreductase [Deltaproteobacteria bacterium]|nr:SDR family NAD(P)-dependent oxidoreductase [Deltaproteobacteria bacterium]MBW2724471.1 SDR family NAD(P)-dependent oxidoreductase [Deltaproteobacteria bacterium]
MAETRAPVESSLPADPVVLLTGASTGIGLALARKLTAWPAGRIVLTARESSLDRFERAGVVESERVWLRALDITDGVQRQRVTDEIRERLGGVDILINNAGIAYRAVTEQIDEEENLAQVSTNFLGPMDLTRLVLPQMRKKRCGRVINISSVSGMMAMPTMGAYSGSKFALEGATESLWYEMKSWGIHVTLVQPGFIHSNSIRNVVISKQARESIENESDPYHAVYLSMTPFIERLMAIARATPEDIANRVLLTLRKKKPRLRVFATIDARFFYILRRVLPRKVFHSLLYRALPGVRGWGPRV